MTINRKQMAKQREARLEREARNASKPKQTARSCKRSNIMCAHDRIFNYLTEFPDGLTSDECIQLVEIEDNDGIPKVNTVAPTITIFRKLGIVRAIDTKLTRSGRSADVLILTDDAPDRFADNYKRKPIV